MCGCNVGERERDTGNRSLHSAASELTLNVNVYNQQVTFRVCVQVNVVLSVIHTPTHTHTHTHTQSQSVFMVEN